LVVTRNRHGNLEPVVTADLDADLTRVVERKFSRWSVETIFRDPKQSAGLSACQCWTDQAMVRHVALVLLAFVVLQRLRLDPADPVGTVKERWQLAITRQGNHPPSPSEPAQPTSERPRKSCQSVVEGSYAGWLGALRGPQPTHHPYRRSNLVAR
jgi:hypothetical protein